MQEIRNVVQCQLQWIGYELRLIGYHNESAEMKAHSFRVNFISLAIAVSLSACGGASGGDAEDIATDEFTALDDPQLADSIQQDDEFVCAAEIDIAEFFLTEVDRQWSCQITSLSGIRFDQLFFDRSGTAISATNGVLYWNRNLPGDEVNLASPNLPSMLMSQISSSNTVLMFNTVTSAGEEQSFDCVLVPREISS